MSKVRVYELARELGIENKELIARLEKLGILSKKPTSTLEDAEVEKVKRDFRGVEQPQEMEEKRIKSTVIRRRAVRTAAEEVPAPAPEEPVAAEPEKPEAAAEPVKEEKKEAQLPPSPPEKPQPEAPQRQAPATAAAPVKEQPPLKEAPVQPAAAPPRPSSSPQPAGPAVKSSRP